MIVHSKTALFDTDFCDEIYKNGVIILFKSQKTGEYFLVEDKDSPKLMDVSFQELIDWAKVSIPSDVFKREFGERTL
jgi:hypothetical protein